jgi:hypothetical protein
MDQWSKRAAGLAREWAGKLYLEFDTSISRHFGFQTNQSAVELASQPDASERGSDRTLCQPANGWYSLYKP